MVLFNLAPMLRSLTMTPAGSAIDLARRMARRHLEEGGAVTRPSAPKPSQPEADFVLPAGIEPVAVAKAIRAKLDIADGDDPLRPLERRKLGGHVVLRRRHLLRLGEWPVRSWPCVHARSDQGASRSAEALTLPDSAVLRIGVRSVEAQETASLSV
jgi:hypothetical protein